MADDDNKNHNDGEKDAAEYAGYNPPNSWIETHLNANHEQYQKENDDYAAGWVNGQKQRD